MVRGAPNSYNVHIKGHWSQIIVTNTMITKIFEILRELPKCHTGTQSKQILLGEVAPTDLLSAGLPLQSWVYKKGSVSAKCSTTKYVCPSKSLGLGACNCGAAFASPASGPWGLWLLEPWVHWSCLEHKTRAVIRSPRGVSWPASSGAPGGSAQMSPHRGLPWPPDGK